MSTPDLLGIPDELKLWIVEYLSLSSPGLLDLRATCKAFHAVTEQHITKKYFTNRAFFIHDKPSLEVLLEISRHPIYSKSMKQIRFCFGAITPPAIDQARRELEGAADEEVMPGRELRSIRRDFRRVHEELHKEFTIFRETGLDRVSKIRINMRVLSCFVREY